MAHEDLKKQYEADALWHPRPWELWEWRSSSSSWMNIREDEGMLWDSSLIYRRKPDAPKKNCAPKTELGQKLQAVREKAIKNGMQLLSEDEVVDLDQPKEEPARPDVAAVEKTLAGLRR